MSSETQQLTHHAFSESEFQTTLSDLATWPNPACWRSGFQVMKNPAIKNGANWTLQTPEAQNCKIWIEFVPICNSHRASSHLSANPDSQHTLSSCLLWPTPLPLLQGPANPLPWGFLGTWPGGRIQVFLPKSSLVIGCSCMLYAYSWSVINCYRVQSLVIKIFLHVSIRDCHSKVEIGPIYTAHPQWRWKQDSICALFELEKDLTNLPIDFLAQVHQHTPFEIID